MKNDSALLLHSLTRCTAELAVAVYSVVDVSFYPKFVVRDTSTMHMSVVHLNKDGRAFRVGDTNVVKQGLAANELAAKILTEADMDVAAGGWSERDRALLVAVNVVLSR